MECHEGATMIKTFRGLIADGVQDTVVLHTNDGTTGYRIVKFEIMAYSPGITNYESIVKIYKISQSAVDGLVDFSDQTLLGAAYLEGHDEHAYPEALSVIFDREVFNQDIYITHSEVKSANAVNYYIELEQFSLDLSESTVATLKDVRNLEYPAPGG